MKKPLKTKYIPTNKSKYVGNSDNIICRSSWERGFCKWLDFNPDVAAWTSESVVIPYYFPQEKGGDGMIHRYFVDFCIRYTSGKVCLIEIKPKSQTIEPKPKPGKRTASFIAEAEEYGKNMCKWQAAVVFAKKNGMHFQIFTESVLKILGIPV